MNKIIAFNGRKAEKYLSVYWFAILFIVAVGIAMTVSAFYGKPIDVRQIEAGILINNIVNCISNNGSLVKEINNENFLEKCHLIFDSKQVKEYYIEINDLKISQGNINLRDFCSLNEESVVCLSKNLYVNLNDGETGKFISILVAVRNTEKNK
jgi:hypothetical protein